MLKLNKYCANRDRLMSYDPYFYTNFNLCYGRYNIHKSILIYLDETVSLIEIIAIHNLIFFDICSVLVTVYVLAYQLFPGHVLALDHLSLDIVQTAT